MNKLKVIIADDEHDALEVLNNIIVDTGNAVVLRAITNPKQVETLVNKHQPDVLFLDVEMPGIDGLQLLKNIREYNKDIKIVMITAYDKYMCDAIKHNVYSYLLKPVDRIELTNVINSLYLLKNKSVESYKTKLKLPVHEGYIFIEVRDIFMLKADGNYTKIFRNDHTHYTSSYNMGRLLKRLPPEMFLRINRGCAVNSSYLTKINKEDCTCVALVRNKEYTLKISNTFLKAFKKSYH